MSKEKSGGIRLARMIRGGLISKSYLWIDSYNQIVSDIAGTITTRIDGACQYFVSIEDEEIRTGAQQK